MTKNFVQKHDGFLAPVLHLCCTSYVIIRVRKKNSVSKNEQSVKEEFDMDFKRIIAGMSALAIASTMTMGVFAETTQSQPENNSQNTQQNKEYKSSAQLYSGKVSEFNVDNKLSTVKEGNTIVVELDDVPVTENSLEPLASGEPQQATVVSVGDVKSDSVTSTDGKATVEITVDSENIEKIKSAQKISVNNGATIVSSTFQIHHEDAVDKSLTETENYTNGVKTVPASKFSGVSAFDKLQITVVNTSSSNAESTIVVDVKNDGSAFSSNNNTVGINSLKNNGFTYGDGYLITSVKQQKPGTAQTLFDNNYGETRVKLTSTPFAEIETGDIIYIYLNGVDNTSEKKPYVKFIGPHESNNEVIVASTNDLNYSSVKNRIEYKIDSNNVNTIKTIHTIQAMGGFISKIELKRHSAEYTNVTNGTTCSFTATSRAKVGDYYSVFVKDVSNFDTSPFDVNGTKAATGPTQYSYWYNWANSSTTDMSGEIRVYAKNPTDEVKGTTYANSYNDISNFRIINGFFIRSGSTATITKVTYTPTVDTISYTSARVNNNTDPYWFKDAKGNPKIRTGDLITFIGHNSNNNLETKQYLLPENEITTLTNNACSIGLPSGSSSYSDFTSVQVQKYSGNFDTTIYNAEEKKLIPVEMPDPNSNKKLKATDYITVNATGTGNIQFLNAKGKAEQINNKSSFAIDDEKATVELTENDLAKLSTIKYISAPTTATIESATYTISEIQAQNIPLYSFEQDSTTVDFSAETLDEKDVKISNRDEITISFSGETEDSKVTITPKNTENTAEPKELEVGTNGTVTITSGSDFDLSNGFKVAVTTGSAKIHSIDYKKYVPYVPTVNPYKQKLLDKIKEAEALKEEDYTAETWANLKTALETAKNVNVDKATEKDVEDLDNAIKALTKKPDDSSSSKPDNSSSSKPDDSSSNPDNSETEKPHTHTYKIVKVNATYFTNGYTAKKCSCGNITNKKTIPMLQLGKPISRSFDTSIKVRWPEAADASGYAIFVNGKKVKTVSAKGERLAVITGIKPGTEYKITVKPYKKTGSEIVYGKASVTLTTATRPEMVKYSIKPGKTSAKISWKKVHGATGYKVYFRKAGSDEWKVVKTTDSKTTSYTKTGLKSGEKYYFTVKAFKKAGNKTLISTRKVTGFYTK